LQELVRSRLESRFGPLPSAALAEIEAMTSDRLSELGCALLDASSLEELGLLSSQNDK
jgi:hypothetical protein